MNQNKNYKRNSLKILTIAMTILMGGQPALAAYRPYRRKDEEDAIHFLQSLAEDEAGTNSFAHEILEDIELFDTNFGVSLGIDGPFQLGTEDLAPPTLTGGRWLVLLNPYFDSEEGESETNLRLIWAYAAQDEESQKFLLVSPNWEAPETPRQFEELFQMANPDWDRDVHGWNPVFDEDNPTAGLENPQTIYTTVSNVSWSPPVWNPDWDIEQSDDIDLDKLGLDGETPAGGYYDEDENRIHENSNDAWVMTWDAKTLSENGNFRELLIHLFGTIAAEANLDITSGDREEALNSWATDPNNEQAIVDFVLSHFIINADIDDETGESRPVMRSVPATGEDKITHYVANEQSDDGTRQRLTVEEFNALSPAEQSNFTAMTQVPIIIYYDVNDSPFDDKDNFSPEGYPIDGNLKNWDPENWPGATWSFQQIYDEDGAPTLLGEHPLYHTEQRLNITFQNNPEARNGALTESQIDVLDKRLDYMDAYEGFRFGNKERVGNIVQNVSLHSFRTSGTLENLHNDEYRNEHNALNAPSRAALLDEIKEAHGADAANVFEVNARRYYAHLRSPGYLPGSSSAIMGGFGMVGGAPVTNVDKAHYTRYIKMMIDPTAINVVDDNVTITYLTKGEVGELSDEDIANGYFFDDDGNLWYSMAYRDVQVPSQVPLQLTANQIIGAYLEERKAQEKLDNEELETLRNEMTELLEKIANGEEAYLPEFTFTQASLDFLASPEGGRVIFTPLWEEIILGDGENTGLNAAGIYLAEQINRKVSGPYNQGMFGSINGLGGYTENPANGLIAITGWIASGLGSSGNWRIVGKNILTDDLTEKTWSNLSGSIAMWSTTETQDNNIYYLLNTMSESDTLTIALPRTSYNSGFASTADFVIPEIEGVTPGADNDLMFLTIRRNNEGNRNAMLASEVLQPGRHDNASHLAQNFIWQKYTVSVTQQKEDLFTFVSYSTAVPEGLLHDIRFATMTFMEGATFGEEGAFELLEQEPPPPEEDNGNGDNGNGTPPNGENGQNNNGGTPPNGDSEQNDNGDTTPNGDNEQNGSGKDNGNEDVNDGAEDNDDNSANGDNDTNVNGLITGAENIDLPQTGTATSALGLAGLATLGVATTTLVGKKRNKDRKNTKK
ncbi:MAG: LPXTG cell wall anchor domain-containing protein [Streptococcaceae bacterium]|nr:LPXTG cell wall anchor domain-containing protein [Streptococcaceae bacterium]